MYVYPIDRNNMFNSADVHCRSNATEAAELICYECKLNNNKDLSLQELSLEGCIDHMMQHKDTGHKINNYQLDGWLLQRRIEQEAVTSVTIHYAVDNGGDGSASAVFFKSAEEAEQFDADMEEGWGEACNATKKLHFDKDGVLINAEIL